MTAEMKNSLPERRDLQVREPVLRNKLATMELPPTMRSFARYSQGGLHLIGVESKQPKSDPLLVALPGFAHANWSYIDLIQALGREQIEITALSFPGDGESKPFEKSMEDLRADDYTNAAKTLLKEVGRPVILVGHSFGGLVAQKIADDEDVKNAIQGLVLINSVPPSSLRARNVPAAGGVFHPKDDMVWKERLFAGMDSPDREWWFRELDKAEASVAVMNDYVAGNAGGLVDPSAIKVPILELSGSEDMNVLTTLKERSDAVSEFSDKGNRERGSITEFYKAAGHDENAWHEIIAGAPHDMILGPYAPQLAEAIKRRFYTSD